MSSAIGLAVIADQARGRGEVHERTALLFAEQPRRGVRDIERAHQMNLDDGFEGIDAHAMEDGVTQDAGIVDHAIELAETVDRGLDDPARWNSLGDGFEIRHRRAAALPDFLDHFFRGCRAAARTVGGAAGIVDHDPGALGGAQQRNLAANAASRAGNDDDLAFE
jgi:hypothetical protein